jgi:hypothetical protein
MRGAAQLTAENFSGRPMPVRLLCSVKMDPGEFTRSQPIRCDSCRQTTPSYDIVNYGSMERGYRRLCSQCFNIEVPRQRGWRDSNMPSSNRWV